MHARMHLSRVLAASVVSSASFFVACGGAGGAAQTVRPADPTYASASTSTSCRAVENYGEPLVVDWRPEHRADLELTMRESVAVVRYDCHTLRLLKDCTLEGKYGFVGVTKKEQVIQLRDEDELRANLPLGGGALAMQMSGDLQRGSALDIALVMIGKQTTARASASRAELKGTCEGATHFVRRATVGAFAMQTGTRAAISTAAQLFQAGASASSGSAKNVRSTDGDPAACSRAGTDGHAAPDGCSAILRLELTAIDAPTTASARSELDVAACPTGMVRSEGKCTNAAAADHDCSFDEPALCSTQCEKGNALSCGRLGWDYGKGYKVPKDEKRAVELMGRACEANAEDTCSALGVMYLNGNSAVAKDVGRAKELFERACLAGGTRGCHNVGVLHRDGIGGAKDPKRALGYFTRACDGGLAIACAGVADLVEPESRARALEYSRRACVGGYDEACKDTKRLDGK